MPYDLGEVGIAIGEVVVRIELFFLMAMVGVGVKFLEVKVG